MLINLVSFLTSDIEPFWLAGGVEEGNQTLLKQAHCDR